MRAHLCLLLLLACMQAHAAPIPEAAPSTKEQAAEAARKKATLKRQRALRVCHKELEGKELDGAAREAAMQNCLAEKTKATD